MFWNRKKKGIQLIAPADGKIVPLSEVRDEVFSQAMVGPGFAVIPEGGMVEFKAPIAGVIDMVFDTGHAFGIKSDEGLEILIHIGIDTVGLGGQGFEKLRLAGERVNVGDPVIRADLDYIKSKGLMLDTPVILTDMTKTYEVVMNQEGAEIKLK